MQPDATFFGVLAAPADPALAAPTHEDDNSMKEPPMGSEVTV